MSFRFRFVATFTLAGMAALIAHSSVAAPGSHTPPPPPPKSGPHTPPGHTDPPKPLPPVSDTHSAGQVRGILSSVNQTGKSLVITPEGGTGVTLQVDAKSHLAINGKPATLADLAGDVGKPAGALYDRSVTPAVARLILVITKPWKGTGGAP